MEKKQINPWTWQDALGFSQAWRVDEARSVVFLAGQAGIDPDGQIVGAGDIEAQARQAFENLRTVLEASGASFDSVVRLVIYLTDMSKLREVMGVKAEYMEGPQPASSAIGVAALARPEMLLEIEATAVV